MWKVWDLLQAWALMIFQGVHNPEQSKALVHRELGVLFGRRRFLSCESLRRSWPLLVSYCLPSLSGKYLARQLIKLGYVSRDIVSRRALPALFRQTQAGERMVATAQVWASGVLPTLG